MTDIRADRKDDTRLSVVHDVSEGNECTEVLLTPHAVNNVWAMPVYVSLNINSGGKIKEAPHNSDTLDRVT